MKFIAILRGINVSGQKKIKMADLQALFESLHLKNVQTYIQSGNVIFDTNKDQVEQLKTEIQRAIKASFSFEVPVVIRSQSELDSIVNECPFQPVDLDTQGTKVLVSFLSDPPVQESIDRLMENVFPPEQLLVRNKEVYLHCPNGYGRTKLSNTYIEKKLGVTATTRNWKSVCKLKDLSTD